MNCGCSLVIAPAYTKTLGQNGIANLEKDELLTIAVQINVRLGL